jgi:hypothetical protein
MFSITKKSSQLPYYLSNKRMSTDEIVSIFLLLVVALFVLYPEEIVLFGHTILGKTIAVALIIGFTCLDVISGILVCLLVIFFYENSIVEGMLNTMATADPNYQNLENKKKMPESRPRSSPMRTDDGLDVFDWMSDPSDFQQEDTLSFQESFINTKKNVMPSYDTLVNQKIDTEVELVLPKIDIR